MEKYLLSKEDKARLRTIREEGAKIARSKETALKFLKESGILDFVKKATKAANEDGNPSNARQS